MDPYDQGQLNFIMSLSDEEFDVWAMSIPDDDIQYAIELIQTARLLYALQEQELLDELEDSDLAEANAVLKKFML
jgi:hypothetical protein